MFKDNCAEMLVNIFIHNDEECFTNQYTRFHLAMVDDGSEIRVGSNLHIMRLCFQQLMDSLLMRKSLPNNWTQNAACNGFIYNQDEVFIIIGRDYRKEKTFYSLIISNHLSRMPW